MRRRLTVLTGPDVVQGGQHAEHEGGGHCDGVPRLLQHELIPSDHLGQVKPPSETAECPHPPNIRRMARERAASVPMCMLSRFPVRASQGQIVTLTCMWGVR